MRPRIATRCFILGLGAIALWQAYPTAASPPSLIIQAGPEESVTAVAYSPDGRFVASNSFDGRVRIYDAGSGALLRAIGMENNPGGRAIAFAPDGRTLAIAGYHMDKRVPLIDAETGSVLRSLPGHDAIETCGIAFSPDGKSVASSGRDRKILVWKTGTGTLRHRLEVPSDAIALAFSPDGKVLASGGEDRAVRLWDAATGRQLRELSGHRDAVNALAFAPDGRTLASGSTDWGYHRGRDSSRFGDPPRRTAGEIRIWDLDSGTLKRTIDEPGRLSSLAYAPDGKALAAGIGDEVRLYDPAGTGKGIAVAKHGAEVTSIAFAPDGAAIVSGGHDRALMKVALPGREQAWRQGGYFEQVDAVAISPDGALIAAGSADLRFTERHLEWGDEKLGPGGLRLWNTRTGRLIRRLGGPADQVGAVAFSPDGRRVAAGGGAADGAGAVRLWDVATGNLVWERADHRRDVMALLFAPGGNELISGGLEGRIFIRDAATGSVQRALPGHEGPVTALAMPEDDSILISGGSDLAVRTWDPRTGAAGRVLHPEGSASKDPTAILSIALSRDGKTLATLSSEELLSNFGDRSVHVWDFPSGKPKLALSRPQSRGRLLMLSPDGRTLASSGTGKSIALWDLATGRLLREMVGHGHPPLSAAFTPDGRALISGGDFRTLMDWDVANGELLATLVTFSESREGRGDDWVAYTPSGAYDGPAGVGRFLAWRVGAALLAADRMPESPHRPDRLEGALRPR